MLRPRRGFFGEITLSGNVHAVSFIVGREIFKFVLWGKLGDVFEVAE